MKLVLGLGFNVHFRKPFSLNLYGSSTFADRPILNPIDYFDSLFAVRSLDPWSKAQILERKLTLANYF